MTLAEIVAQVGSVFTAGIGWVSDVASTVVGNPIILLFCVIPLVGLGVGLFKRLINVN